MNCPEKETNFVHRGGLGVSQHTARADRVESPLPPRSRLPFNMSRARRWPSRGRRRSRRQRYPGMTDDSMLGAARVQGPQTDDKNRERNEGVARYGRGMAMATEMRVSDGMRGEMNRNGAGRQLWRPGPGPSQTGDLQEPGVEVRDHRRKTGKRYPGSVPTMSETGRCH